MGLYFPLFYYQINFIKFNFKLINKLLFPEGISYSLEENITTPQKSTVFNAYRENIEQEGNLVELRGIEPLTSTLPV
jgi:hypothetical protein